MRTRVSRGGVGISQSEMTEGVRPGSASFYITTLTKHKVAAGMFSFARQKRTRKAPATFDAREARPGFHPGPQSGGRRDKIGRCAYGTDAFSDFAPTPIGKNAYRKQLQGGEKPSPSRLCRATSPERERLWQRRKVCSLTAGFFLPLTNGGRNSPVLPRARPSKDFPRPGEDVAGRRQKGELAVERSETERVRPGSRPSPSRLRRATSPERERLWQRRKVYALQVNLFCR